MVALHGAPPIKKQPTKSHRSLRLSRRAKNQGKMKIRIGKDLNIRWSILTNNEPTPLEGRNLNLLLQDPSRQQRALSFTTEGNTIISYIPAAELTRLGDYILTLKENEGEEGQTVVDAKPAFTLVEYTTEESSEPTDPSLSVADITLSTANLAYGITIQDVFGGEDGGTIQGGDIVPVLRNGVLTRASQTKSEKTYNGIIHKSVPEHPLGGNAYIFRGHRFIPVFHLFSTDNLRKYIEWFGDIFDDPGTYEKPRYNVTRGYGSIVKGYIGEPISSTTRNKEILDEYTRKTDISRLYIRFITHSHFEYDIALYIDDNDSDRIITDRNAYFAPVHKNCISMLSERFFIQGDRVYCNSIPKLNKNCWWEDHTHSCLIVGEYVNAFRPRYKRRGRRYYDSWKYETIKGGEGRMIGNTKKIRRHLIKLECGETRAFMRHKYRLRGTSVHHIIMNGRDIINNMGGGNRY